MTYKLLIDGQFVDGASCFDVVNPATDQPFTSCPKASQDQLDQAVAGARRAFPSWSGLPIEQRGEALLRIADAMVEAAGELAALLTREQGKPIPLAMGEVTRSAATLRFFATQRLEPQLLRDGAQARIVEYRRALGVVAAITPWNFPLSLLINKLGPALITGNTMVIKPAPTTPLTTLRFAELASRFLPDGVINVICDENDLGAKLTCHPGVDKIAFTGSTETGRKVLESAADGIKRVTLELGGNDAAIALDDVAPEAVARKFFAGAMSNAGQICVAIKRAYVPRGIYDEVCERMTLLAEQAVVGDGAVEGTEIGPVQNRRQFERVCDLIREAATCGNVIAGGEPLDRAGYFIPPTLVRDLPDEARLIREEQFGPVLPIIAYDDVDEVVGRVNDGPFGLGGSIWSRDIARAEQVARRVTAGTIWINQHVALDPAVPFRGAKQSGLGGELGQQALDQYTQGYIVNARHWDE